MPAVMVCWLCRCNRYKQQQEADKEVRKARKGMLEDYMKEAEEGKATRLERFNHYHSRYSNHLNSLEVSFSIPQSGRESE